MIPVTNMPLQQPNNFPSGGAMSTLPPDLIGKVLKDVTKNATNTISNHLNMQISEAMQNNVPWGNIVDTLVKMAPATINPGFALMGGGSPPPGGPGDISGMGNKPPQQPTGASKNQDSLSPATIIDNNGNASLLGSQIASQKAQVAQPTQQQVNPEMFDMLSKLLISGGAGLVAAGGGSPAPVLGMAQKRMEIAGESQKELNKLMVENEKERKNRQIKFFENLNQPLSSAKDLSLTESALTGIGTVTNLLGVEADASGNVSIKNPSLLKDINWLKKNRQELMRARDLFINKTLRRDSGATITKDDEKAASKSLGFDIGWGSFMQNPSVIAKSLLESKDQLLRDRNRLSPDEETRQIYQKLKAANVSNDDIYAYLELKGRA